MRKQQKEREGAETEQKEEKEGAEAGKQRRVASHQRTASEPHRWKGHGGGREERKGLVKVGGEDRTKEGQRRGQRRQTGTNRTESETTATKKQKKKKKRKERRSVEGCDGERKKKKTT